MGTHALNRWHDRRQRASLFAISHTHIHHTCAVAQSAAAPSSPSAIRGCKHTVEFRLELFGIEFPAALRADDHSIAVDAVSEICSDEVAVLEREGTRLVPVDGRFVGVVPGAVYHVVTALEQLVKAPAPVAPPAAAVDAADAAKTDGAEAAAVPQTLTKEITRGVTPPSARDAAVRPKKKVPLSLALDGSVTVPVEVEPAPTTPAQQQQQQHEQSEQKAEEPEPEPVKVSNTSEHSLSGFFKRLVKKTQQQQQQQQQQEKESTEQEQQNEDPVVGTKDGESGKDEEKQEEKEGDAGIKFLAPKEGEEPAARGIAAVLADDGDMPEDKNERLRLKCVREIILTEEAYLEDLETLESVFMMPIQFQQVLSAEQFQRLFSNAAMLKPIHAELVQKLKDEAAAAGGAGVHVGAAFLALCQYLKMYTVYCANHDSAVALLEELRQDKAFMHTLGVCETDRHARGQGLASFLIKPVQRVCKYPLFFRELLGFTPADDPDHAALAEAKARIDDVVRHINEGKRKLEQQQKMVDILASIDGEWAEELITPTRYLVSETRLCGCQRRSASSSIGSSSSSSSSVGGAAGAGAAALLGGGPGAPDAAAAPEPDVLATHGERHDYMLFVFSDLVVVCRCAAGAGRHGRPFVLRAAIPMYCVRVVVIADDERVRNSFEILHANPVTNTVAAAGGFQFFAKDAAARDALVRTLKALVKDTLRRFYAHRSNRAALISLAPQGAASSEPVTPPPEAVAAAAAGNELAAATGEASSHHPS